MRWFLRRETIAGNVVEIPRLRQKDCAARLVNLVETREYKRHWTELTAKHIVLAPNYWSERFAKISRPMFEQMDALMRKNLNLRRTRDLLLPKLIIGEVEIDNLTSKGT